MNCITVASPEASPPAQCALFGLGSESSCRIAPCGPAITGPEMFSAPVVDAGDFVDPLPWSDRRGSIGDKQIDADLGLRGKDSGGKGLDEDTDMRRDDHFAELYNQLDAELMTANCVHESVPPLWQRFYDATELNEFRELIMYRSPGPLMPAAQFFEVVLEKKDDSSLGFGVHKLSGMHVGILILDEISSNGPLDRWNRQRRQEGDIRRVVHPFSALKAVNKVADDPKLMNEELKNSKVSLLIACPRCVLDVAAVYDILGGHQILGPFWRDAHPAVPSSSPPTMSSSSSRGSGKVPQLPLASSTRPSSNNAKSTSQGAAVATSVPITPASFGGDVVSATTVAHSNLAADPLEADKPKPAGLGSLLCGPGTVQRPANCGERETPGISGGGDVVAIKSGVSPPSSRLIKPRESCLVAFSRNCGIHGAV